jgi:hypothetical protein
MALVRGLAQHGYELGSNLAFQRRGAEKVTSSDWRVCQRIGGEQGRCDPCGRLLGIYEYDFLIRDGGLSRLLWAASAQAGDPSG